MAGAGGPPGVAQKDPARNRDRGGRRTTMNRAVEDLLREGLDRLTSDVRVPPGVTGKARTHLRRKKIAVRAALAGGAAAAAVVAATVPARIDPGPFHARAAAYVVTRVANALAATNKVVHARTTFSA